MGSSTQYRPDIDGLRAVAVGLVILYHLGTPPFQGGYIGVDVFFVISGYLITGIIRKEILETGRFDLARFFARRFHRLYPALFAVLALSFVAGFLLMGPQHFQALCASILFGSLGASNLYFWLTSGYFDANADLKPLLHTWSLGVETQFYLVWPFALLALMKLNRRWVLVVLAAITLASLLASQYWIRDASAVFYLPQFRIFEFAIGAALIWIDGPTGPRVIREAGGLIGICLVIATAVLFNDKTTFPGLAALLPCLGSALIIHFGHSRYVGSVLRSTPMVGLGKISYSLYLVHWPAYVFYKYYEFQELSVAQDVALLIVILLASIGLYFMVERPFRRSRLQWPHRSFLVMGLLIVLVGAPASWAWANQGLEFRTGVANVPIPAGFDQCDYPVCRFGKPDKVDFVVVGDSHARHLFDGLRQLASSEGLSFAVFHFDPYCSVMNAARANEDRSYNCQSRLNDFLTSVQRNHPSRMILAYRWRDVRAAADGSLNTRLTELMQQPQLQSIKATALILNVPEFYENKTPQGCVVPKYLFPSATRNCESVSEETPFYDSIRKLNVSIANQIAASTALVIDPFEVLCDGSKCYQQQDGHWLYADAHHLSDFAADKIIDAYKGQLLAFLKPETSARP